MKKFIKRVTVSGAGDDVNPLDLVSIANEFPFVEFGIQLARGSKKYWHRFPSDDWLHSLVETCAGRNINFSGHICFHQVRELLVGNWPKQEFDKIHPAFRSAAMFNRFQINTHAEPHDVDYMKLPYVLQELHDLDQSVIFQYDGVNDEIVHHCTELGYTNVSLLFDTSHGAGILPDDWPTPIEGVYCGYSGGLGPQNLETELPKIAEVVGDTQIWIDAERHLRSEDDKQFDLTKVRKFLEAAQPWVVQ